MWFAIAPLARIVAGAILVLALACQAPPVTGRPGDPGAGGRTGDSPADPNRPDPVRPPGTGIDLPDAAPTAGDAGSGSGACKPLSCTPAGGNYCGRIGDGCGHVLDCKDPCPMGTTCGGSGVKNLCGSPRDPNCKPIACKQMGGQLCGKVGDGCGGTLDCGDCPGGTNCGAQIANVCGAAGGAAPGGANVCDGLCAQRPACPMGAETTLTGTVLAPTPSAFGAPDPIYNAIVYVPNRPVEPFKAGVACELCGTPVSGAPLVTALTGPDGRFTLKNVPAGDDIPLVIQIGRWRRQVKIPRVEACQAHALGSELTRLPRNRAEGEIPQMAIGTGRYDPFECVLRKIGISDSEFTPPTGPGRVHVYKFLGHELGQPTPPASTLVGDAATLGRYDIVILPCDDSVIRPPAELGNLSAYTAMGGRLFLTDLSHSWLKDMGKFQSSVQWFDLTRTVGADFQAVVDQAFPKGQAFATWLQAVGASLTPGRIPVHDRYRGPSYVGAVNPPTQRWLYTEGATFSTVQHFTFNTPVGAPADQQCGRVVFSNFHVAEEMGVGDGPILTPTPTPPPSKPFPGHCQSTPMTPQEKALEFMLFDASSCILPDTDRPQVFQPPAPPPPPPPPSVD